MSSRSALVTGGSRGIGLGIAERLLGEGYRVVINGVRSAGAVAGTLDELARLGEVSYVAADVGDPAGRSHLVAETLGAVGRLDVLINNAGITSPGRKDILDVSEEDLDTVLAVNLKGPFLLTQSLAKHMVEEHESDPAFRGCIINVTSVSAALASPNRAEYCISKAGLSMTTMLWAVRLAEHGIDVFEVRPGVIQTDMTAPVADKYDSLIEAGLTLERRFGTPGDVGAAVAALAGGEIPYATGQILTIDGGLTVARL
ncbi:MAG: 3-ketoacyl-ACP reductase [Acidimicrobiia bacterium]|nr:3-ketoacyl-ACP reductase [Acidimicrobiia bacterium]